MDRVLSFDIGGSFFKAAMVLPDGTIVSRDRQAVPPRREQAIAVLQEMAGRLTKGLDGRIAGIGVGAPGAIDRDRAAIAGYSENISHLVDVSMKEVFAGLSDRVCMDNDANNAAHGEHRWGAARGMDTALVITLGTGIGGGVIVHGRVLSGASGYAGEFGHMIVDPNGRRCTCGGTGCIEAYASAWALRERSRDIVKRHPETMLARISGRAVEPLDIVEAASSGDPWAGILVREAGQMLGTALASAANLLNPEAVIIGGGIAAAGPVLLDPLEESFRFRVLPAAGRACRVLPAALGNDAGLLGAASLVLDEEAG